MSSAILRFLHWAPPSFGKGFRGCVSQVQAAALSGEVLFFTLFTSCLELPASALGAQEAQLHGNELWRATHAVTFIKLVDRAAAGFTREFLQEASCDFPDCCLAIRVWDKNMYGTSTNYKNYLTHHSIYPRVCHAFVAPLGTHCPLLSPTG